MSGCPECEATGPAGSGTQLGEILVCPDCGEEQEGMALNPIVLSVAPREVED